MIVEVLLLLAAGTSSEPPVVLLSPGGEERPREVICKQATQTGTRLASKRECHTAAEWVLIKKENAELIERNRVRMQDQAQ